MGYVKMEKETLFCDRSHEALLPSFNYKSAVKVTNKAVVHASLIKIIEDDFQDTEKLIKHMENLEGLIDEEINV